MPRLHLANVRQCLGLFRSRSVAAGIPPRPVNDGHFLVLLFDQFRNVRCRHDVVIGMSHDDQNIDLVARVRPGIRFGLLTLSEGKSNACDEESQPKREITFHS